MSAAILTPYRETVVTFDLPEPVVGEAPYNLYRPGKAIARAGLGPGNSEHVHQLATGGWALMPYQEVASHIHERTDTAQAIIPASDLTLAQGVVSQNRWRQEPNLLGVAYDPNVAQTGDPFLLLQVAGGSSWQKSDNDADIASFGQVTLPTTNVPADRLGVGKVSYPADQPYYWRFETPGTTSHSPDLFGTFYFGGPICGNGFGEYALAVSGEGYAILYLRVKDGTGTWKFIALDQWRYCEPHRAAGASHTIRIWPHSSGTNKYIEFRSSVTAQAPGIGSVVQGYTPAQIAPTTHLFNVSHFRLIDLLIQVGIDVVQAAIAHPNVTGHGPIRYDVRREQRMHNQFSLLRFFATGTLVDLPFAIPLAPTQDLTISWHASVPDGAGVTGRLLDVTTGAELSLVESGPSYQTYAPNAGQSHYFARFDFTSTPDQAQTPILWSYSVRKDGVIDTTTVTPFTANLVRSVNISGAERDITHETASLIVEDPNDTLYSLSYRASQRTQIATRYDPSDPTKVSILFDGRAQRNTATRKGTNKSLGMGNGGAARAYPSPTWKEYHCDLVGMWQRLHNKPFGFLLDLANDPTAPVDPDHPDKLVPFKVTDILRAALGWAGFAADQIDVPDAPMRFWPAANESADNLLVQPFVFIGEMIVTWAYDYLGWFLIWDGNAGTRGMWRLRPPAVPPYNNLAAFVTSAPTNGAPRFSTAPQTYGSTNWVGTGAHPVQTFIRKGTLQSYVIPPEANAVILAAVGEPLTNGNGSLRLTQWAINCRSIFDPTSPDYLGELIPIIKVDTALAISEAAAWVTRRYFDFVCHAVQMTTFDAPLVLVTDPTDTNQSRPRPLRYYDAVTIDGAQYLIRNVNPAYVKDGFQMARYECESPRASSACQG